jgi:hypothetical protein
VREGRWIRQVLPTVRREEDGQAVRMHTGGEGARQVLELD